MLLERDVVATSDIVVETMKSTVVGVRVSPSSIKVTESNVDDGSVFSSGIVTAEDVSAGDVSDRMALLVSAT